MPMWAALSAMVPSLPAPPRIASAVEAALLAIRLIQKNRRFGSGEGVVKDTVDGTVEGARPLPGGNAGDGQVILDVMVNR